MTEIEELKAQIKVLEKKLSFLEELEKTKSPVEEAYKRWMGVYPPTNPSVDNIFDIRWRAFQMGYNAAQKDYKVGEFQETAQERGERVHKEMEEVVRESVKWCEEHPDTDPLDWLKPQNPEQVADGLKEAFREAVKQGVVSSVDKPKKNRDSLDDMMDKMVEELKLKQKSLYDVIDDWWSDIFTTGWDDRTCINTLVDEISLWLPKHQSAAGSQNAYVESAVEGFNDCLDKIRGKLR
jgi:hypothetical protein